MGHGCARIFLTPISSESDAMKFARALVILILAMLAPMGTSYAQPAREQLMQMVDQLQRTPADTALRERIIKLATSMKPAPAIPDEAERRMARGTLAFKGAKSVAEYQDAIKEFELAVAAAPWFTDAYFNLGVAQDKAEKYADALQSLKFALISSPDSKDIKARLYEVEYRSDKVTAAAAKAKQDVDDARRRADEARRLAAEREANKHLWAQNLVQELQRKYGTVITHGMYCRANERECTDLEANGSNWVTARYDGKNYRFVIELTGDCEKDQISIHYNHISGSSYHGYCGSVRGPDLTDVEWTFFIGKSRSELKFSDSAISIVYSCDGSRRCTRNVWFFKP